MEMDSIKVEIVDTMEVLKSQQIGIFGTMFMNLIEYILFPFYKFLLVIWYLPVKIISACHPKKKVSALKTEIPRVLLTPAHEIVKQIINQEVTCRSIINAYIARINEVNPIVNAVVENRFDAALREADLVDQKVRDNALNDSLDILYSQCPLLGVPITVKESIYVEGMSNTAGCFNAAGRKAPKNADIVQKCKDAGAIILAVTNTPELCMNWETYNNLVGTTRNPYDSRRTTGGSSGGEGALLGAGASVVGLGSDIAGSLRLPAHYCGIFSHKPTGNVVSTIGHYPDSTETEHWNRHFVLGPMTRYATDLLPMMNILIKDEFKEQLNLNRQIQMNKVKIYFLKDFGSCLNSKLDTEMSSALDFLLDHFKLKHNCTISALKENFFKNTIFDFVNILLEIRGVDDYFYDKPKRNAFIDLLRLTFGCSKTALSSIFYVFLRKCNNSLSEETLARSYQRMQTIRSDLEDLLGDNGVLIMPTFHRTADFHYTTLSTCLDTMNTIIANVTSMPASNCPIGWHSNGLPFGVQVISKRFNDKLSIAIAEEIEKICGGWKLSSSS